MKVLIALLLFAISAGAQTSAPKDDPKSLPYSTRVLARGFGNVGKWWSLMNEGDKEAFLDGYQEGMRLANQHDHTVCETMRQMAAKGTTTTIEHLGDIAFVCTEQNETTGFDKVSIGDIDFFYSDIANQFIPTNYSMAYLRDKATGRKTAGQLLDSLLYLEKTFNPLPSNKNP